jgi:hypothetical protein
MRFLATFVLAALPCIYGQSSLSDAQPPLTMKQSKDEPLKIEPIVHPSIPSTSTVLIAVGQSNIPSADNRMTSSLTVVDYTVLSEKTIASTSMELYFYSVPTAVSSTKAFPILMTTLNTKTASCINIVPTYNLQAAQRTHIHKQPLTEKVLKQATLSPPAVEQCPSITQPASIEPMNVQFVGAPKTGFQEIELDLIDLQYDDNNSGRLKLGRKGSRNKHHRMAAEAGDSSTFGVQEDALHIGNSKKDGYMNTNAQTNECLAKTKELKHQRNLLKRRHAQKDHDSDSSDDGKGLHGRHTKDCTRKRR